MEELRRLLYVAVTRARDALYLACEVDKDAIVRAPKRSLASLLPLSLKQAFTRAFLAQDARASLSEADEVHWEASGHQFAARVCRPPSTTAAPTEAAPGLQSVVLSEAEVDREPLWSDAPLVRSATMIEPPFELPAVRTGQATAAEGRDRALERLAGTLVHRVFQLQGQLKWDAPPSVGDVVDHLARLTRPEELVDVPDRSRFFEKVASAFLQLAWRPDVRGWLAAGKAHYEVPFSFISPAEPEVIVRGSIDCLVVHPDGTARVLEFKTGAPRPEHAQQLEMYLGAARHAFPGAILTGELVYPERTD